MEVKAEYRTIFCEEAADQLKEWEESLLALEKNPEDGEQINRMFRAIHTMKGSAGFIGYDGLARLAHDLESSLQQVREAKGSFDSTAASFLFEGLDLCRSMIDSFTEGREAAVDTRDFLARLSAIRPAESPAGGAAQAGPASAAAPPVSAAGPANLCACRLAVHIDGAAREAYLRAFLVKSRIERMGRILAVDPSLESLKDSAGAFSYVVTLETAVDPASIPGSINIDQVTVALAPGAARAGWKSRLPPPLTSG